MNAILKTGLLVGGALLAYNAFAKGSALQTLNFYPKSVRSIRFDGITPVMQLALAIQNTSNQNMILRSFAGNLYSNGYFIANVSSFAQVSVRPNSETIIFINARLSLIGIVQDIIAAFNGSGMKQQLELDARANVDRYNLPVKIKYTIG